MKVTDDKTPLETSINLEEIPELAQKDACMDNRQAALDFLASKSPDVILTEDELDTFSDIVIRDFELEQLVDFCHLLTGRSKLQCVMELTGLKYVDTL